MFKTMRTVVFLLAWIPLAAFAADRPVSEADLAAYKELAQTKLDATKESLQKDKEKIEARLDAQDKRIGDLNFTLTILGILITVSMVGFGAASWFSASNRARLEASEATKKWFDEKGKELEEAIGELRRRGKESHEESLSNIEVLREEMEKHFQSAMNSTMNEVRERAEAVMVEMQKEIGSLSERETDGDVSGAAGKDGEALEQMEQAVRNKPEAEYGFADWNARAFNAWNKDDYEGAARYWKEAARAKGATDKQIAPSLFNAGVALGLMNRIEDSIAVYDEVVTRYGSEPELTHRERVAKALLNKGHRLTQLERDIDAIGMYDEVLKRYGDAPELALREQVAKALAFKGIRLSKLERYEDAIATLDEVLTRFGAETEIALRKWVANALVSKGSILGKLELHEDAIASYDEVIRRLGDASETELRQSLSSAHNGKGFRLLCHAKQNWADAAARQLDLQEAAKLFEWSVGASVDKPVVWGNQAYAAFLLGQSEVARPLLQQALQQGGERLYKGTLGDLNIHPVSPDAEFRAMLEELWAEVKPKE